MIPRLFLLLPYSSSQKSSSDAIFWFGTDKGSGNYIERATMSTCLSDLIKTLDLSRVLKQTNQYEGSLLFLHLPYNQSEPLNCEHTNKLRIPVAKQLI
jgi:hypothetical protein